MGSLRTNWRAWLPWAAILVALSHVSKAEDLPTRILLSGYLLSAAAPWLGKASRWLILDRGHWGRVAGFIAAFVVVFPLPGEALLFLNWQRYGGAPAGFDAESWFFTRR